MWTVWRCQIATMGDYRKLQVWRKARLLRGVAYRTTESFPTEERYGLKGQIRRASGSIMANKAEGAGRNRDREFARFVSIALGSAAELESHFIAANDQGLLELAVARDAVEKTAEVGRMLAGLLKRLRE